MPKRGPDGRPSATIQSLLKSLDAEGDDAANVVSTTELGQDGRDRGDARGGPRALQAARRDRGSQPSAREWPGFALPLAVAVSVLAVLVPLAWMIIEPGATVPAAEPRPKQQRAGGAATGRTEPGAPFAARTVTVEIIDAPVPAAAPAPTSAPLAAYEPPRLITGPTPQSRANAGPVADLPEQAATFVARPIEANAAPPERVIAPERATAQDPQPAPARITAPAVLRLRAGEAVALAIDVEIDPALRDGARVIVRGLPQGATIADAARGSSGDQALPLALAQRARLELPATAEGTSDLALELRDRLGALQATGALKLIVLPGTTSRAVPAGRVDAMLARGIALAGEGDIAGARLMLERAAESGNARAALALAELYDPRRLAERRVLGIGGDPERARFWYERARALSTGDTERRPRD